MEKAKQANSFNKPLPKKKATKKRVVKKSDRFTVSHGQLVCVMLNFTFLASLLQCFFSNVSNNAFLMN